MGNYWKSRKVCVPGGCGFLGSYLVEALVEAEAEVTVVDNLSTSAPDQLGHLANLVRVVQGTLQDFDTCLDVSKGMDVVLNLAGLAHGLEYRLSHHGEMLYHNAVAQLNMLEAARVNDVERVLVTSSALIYPAGVSSPIPELPPMTDTPEPESEGYGWAKRIGELQAVYYHREYGMAITIVRPFNIYGGRYRWSGAKSQIIPTLVKRVMDGEDPLVLWGSGRQARSFLHGRDAAALLLLLTECYAVGDPINLGFQEEVTIAELVDLICEIAEVRPEIQFDTTKPEGELRRSPDATLLRKVTDGYEPTISLREGIGEMIQWYRRSFGE